MDTAEALQIIDAAAERAGETKGATGETIEALRYLRDLGVERSTLIWFWRSLRCANETGRSQNVNAGRNRIKLLSRELGKG
jgi:hypothetical protein